MLAERVYILKVYAKCVFELTVGTHFYNESIAVRVISVKE